MTKMLILLMIFCTKHQGFMELNYINQNGLILNVKEIIDLHLKIGLMKLNLN